MEGGVGVCVDWWVFMCRYRLELSSPMADCEEGGGGTAYWKISSFGVPLISESV